MPQAAGSGPTEEVVVVAGFGNPVAADYAAYLSRRGGRRFVVVADVLERFASAESLIELTQGGVPTLVLFVGPRLSDRDRDARGRLVRMESGALVQHVVLSARLRSLA
jgi:hypothetical protein